MLSFASTILQLALALLLAVNNNPAVSDAQRQQAIAVASQAIQLATKVMGNENISITSVIPSSGPVGSKITITGSGFSRVQLAYPASSNYGEGIWLTNGSAWSYLGGPATASISGDSTIITTVNGGTCPREQSACSSNFSSSLAPGNYSLYIDAANGSIVSNKIPFTVISPATFISPVINSINPTSGAVGTAVTIYGSNFNSKANVYIDGSRLIVPATFISSSQLSFVVQSGIAAGVHSILVVNGQTNIIPFVSNAVNLNIANPLISSPAGSFYADTHRGVPLQVAFFYDGIHGQNYTLNLGDGTSELMTFQLAHDCFPNPDGSLRICPDYFSSHTYSFAGTYIAALKNSSGNTLGTLTISAQ
jgi:hypothetical protein